MNHGIGKPKGVSLDRPTDHQRRVEDAKLSMAGLAGDAIRSRRSGKIGVEVPVKDGVLGKVKRFVIDFQSE